MPFGTWKERDASGNPKPPSLDIVLDWVYKSWLELSNDVIIKSFLACGLSNSLDGSEDDLIACFKPNGSIGEKGLEILSEMRTKSNATDCQQTQIENDEFDDEDGYGVDLNGIEDDLDLFFDFET